MSDGVGTGAAGKPASRRTPHFGMIAPGLGPGEHANPWGLASVELGFGLTEEGGLVPKLVDDSRHDQHRSRVKTARKTSRRWVMLRPPDRNS